MLRRIHSLPGLIVALLLAVLAISGAILSIDPAIERLGTRVPGNGRISVATLADRVARHYPGVEQIQRSPSGTIIVYYSRDGRTGVERLDPLSGQGIGPYNPELVLFAEKNGKPIGFGLSLPDTNMVLKDNKKGYLIPGIIRLLLFKTRINYARVMILGVLPEYQGSGLGAVLFYETGRQCVKRGLPTGEASWVLEDNHLMVRGAEFMGGEITKTYRIYQMPIR